MMTHIPTEKTDLVPKLEVQCQNAELPDADKEKNRALSATWAVGKRGFAVLKNWHILAATAGCTRRVGTIAQAILVLTNEEI